MRIKQIRNRIGVDFWAEFECEHCGVTYDAPGKATAGWHEKVLPLIKCQVCKRSAKCQKLNTEAKLFTIDKFKDE